MVLAKPATADACKSDGKSSTPLGEEKPSTVLPLEGYLFIDEVSENKFIITHTLTGERLERNVAAADLVISEDGMEARLIEVTEAGEMHDTDIYDLLGLHVYEKVGYHERFLHDCRDRTVAPVIWSIDQQWSRYTKLKATVQPFPGDSSTDFLIYNFETADGWLQAVSFPRLSLSTLSFQCSLRKYLFVTRIK